MTHAVHLKRHDQMSGDLQDANTRYPNRLRTSDHKTGLNIPIASSGYTWRGLYSLKDGPGFNNAGKFQGIQRTEHY